MSADTPAPHNGRAGDDAPIARGPIYCRIYTDQCRAGIDVSEHRLEHGRWRCPDGLSEKGYWAFDAEAVQ